MKKVITVVYLNTEYQRCIVQQVRNALKYIAEKDRKLFSADIKLIYHASNEQKATETKNKLIEKQSEKYPIQ